jgi:Carboxypeptidase regulatory-like domain/TonB dependent receptor-like, beta-barrel
MMEHTRVFTPRQTRSTNYLRLVASLILFLCVCIFGQTVQAQTLYGVLTGNVTDSSGAAIADAAVEALNTGTGVAKQAKTDSTGIYRFSDLQAGIYKITITAPSFTTSVAENVQINVSQVRRVDAQLKIASQKENVTVTAEAQILQTDKSDVHTDLSSKEVDDLPTAGTEGRNFQSLLRVIPGAGGTAETNSIAANTQRAINVNINGQSNQGVSTRIDGTSDAYPWLPANVAYVPPADAIQEVNVTTNSFDADQGMAGGAAVNVQIKSGTNQYHGTANWFHFDQNFGAKTYFWPKNQGINRNNQNQFGFTFGGPIIKNKLFFFGDWERTTQRQKAGPDIRTVPTAAMLSGDFRGLPGNPIIYDPATGGATGAGKTQIQCNGVLNVICPGRLDPASMEMATLLQPSVAQEVPTANYLSNFAGSGTAAFTRDNIDAKINWNPSPNSTVFGRYSVSRGTVFDPPLLGDAGGDATNGGQLGDAPFTIYSDALGGTYTFSPNVLLDWNVGYTRQHIGATFGLASPQGLDQLKIPGTNGAGVPSAGDLYNGLPAFQINSGAASLNLGNPNTGNPFLFRDNQYVTAANLSWNHGKHNFRGGIEWNHVGLNHFQPQGGSFQTARGSFLFNGDVTSLPGSTPTWFNSVADFDLGLPYQTGKAYQIQNPIALRWSQWAWYLRDQYQVTSKLTLNLGLRWEYYPFGYSDNGNGFRWFNQSNGNVYIGGNGSVPVNDTVDTGIGQFLPRVGAAWRVTPNTVIRGGYGMSADPNNWRYFRNAYPAAVISNNVPASSSSYIAIASLTGTNGTALGGGAYSVPTGLVNIAPPDTSTGIVPLPTSASTTTVPNPFKRGYIQSFNFTVERELPAGFVIQSGYVGARNTRPLVNMNLNASPVGTGAAGGLLSVALGKTYTGTINGLVPFQSSSYDSLQTKLTRRFTNGSSFGFVWTLSRDLTYEDNEELNSLSFPYPAYWSKNYGPAAFDRTNNFQIYGVMQLPFGKGQHWLKEGVGNYILGGWQLSPIVSIMSGLPFTVTAAGGLANANGSIETANLVAPFTVYNNQPNQSYVPCTAVGCQYFNPAAFAPPAQNTLGTTNRDQFRGPGYFNMNLSLARQFRITERFGLQIRADAIGFTNTPHFANPNSSCAGTPANPTSCTAGNSNFGVVTSTLQPGGFFGPDPGNRSVWLGLRLTF